ncbi:MAG TPA: FecR domain-containing protein [Stellaceae bacterium]|nr:FecR domain-containing protein [Stellaceae bacterium]
MTARRIAVFGLLLGVGLAAFAAPSLADRVGVTAVVVPESDGTPPGGTLHKLKPGEDVAFREKIITRAEGHTDILFLDRSSLSIGPNAEVTIDEFVYAPDKGPGKLTVGAAKGLLRFIGGALSKDDDAVSIKTPAAVIGIRGGIALIDVSQDNTRAIFLYGKELSIDAGNGEIVRITRPGFFSDIAGGHISLPVKLPPGGLNGMLASFDSSTAAKTGAGTTPGVTNASLSLKPLVTIESVKTTIVIKGNTETITTVTKELVGKVVKTLTSVKKVTLKK